MDNIYDELPDDPETAFVFLEAHFREKMDRGVLENPDAENVSYFKSEYITEVLAAARALDIYHLSTWSRDGENVWDFYERFIPEVRGTVVEIKIKQNRTFRTYSVSLEPNEKERVRHYVNRIKDIVDSSNLEESKKDDILKRLNNLLNEIDRNRTRFDRITDTIRVLSRLSGEVEREGAAPWYKWVKLIFGAIDEAKEKEGPAKLPAPKERKSLPPPKSRRPQPIDDDIPF